MGTTDSSPNTAGASGQLFGDTLRQLRRASGLTQAELAERTNLSIRGLSDLERGINRSPRRETFLALADAFGLADEERDRFVAAARRRPSFPAASGSPPSSTSSEPELAPLMIDSEPAVPWGQSSDIQIFLIADVRGYSTYTYEHRDEDAAQLTLRFAALAEAAVRAHGGHVLEVRGDEVLAVFTSARAALRAAILLQEHVGQASATTPEQPIRCGIGVEAGEAIAVPGGYRGQAINLAARLCAQARPGEVLAGEAVMRLARKVAGLVFHDRGLASLKGIAEPVRITQVLVGEPESAEGTGKTGGETEADAALAPTATTAVGNFLSARPEHQLVAREPEMVRLMAALDAVQAGTGRLMFLVGEPGVGKTRLAQEVLQAAQERGFFVVTGRCYAPQETVPYYPFLEVLARAYSAAPATIRSALPQQWPEVGRLVPDRRLGESSASQPASWSADDQQRLFWQVTRFLQALAEEQPLALLLDDLHWMDGASVDLLLHLARHTRDTRILLLGTYREVDVPPAQALARGLSDLVREHLLERIEVRRFALEGTAALLTATLEGGEMSEAVVMLIHEPTEGNAFFAQEVLQALLERGEITQTQERWELRPGAEVVVPETVRAVVLERVARLPSTAQQILAGASVLGQTFLFDDLLSISAPSDNATTEPETTLEEVLEEAVGARILRELSSSQYAFSHVLAQRAVYEQLSARRRRRLHLAVAESLERRTEGERARRIAEVVYHFLQAEEPERALPYLLLAGEQAESVYAHTDAEMHFRKALEIARDLGDQPRQAQALEQLADVLWGTGNFQEIPALLESAAEIHRKAGNLDQLAWDIAGLIRPYTVLGHYNLVLARLEELLVSLGTLARTGSGDMAIGESPLPEVAGSDADRAAAHNWEILAARALTQLSARTAGRVYLAITVCLVNQEEYQQAVPLGECAVRYSQQAGERRLEMRARMFLSNALMAVGRPEQAAVVMEAARTVAEEAGDLEGMGLAEGFLAELLMESGALADSTRAMERSLKAAEEYGGPDALSQVHCGEAWIALYRGAWDETLVWCDRAQAVMATSGLEIISAEITLLQGMVYLYRGQVQQGRDSLKEAIRQSEGQSGSGVYVDSNLLLRAQTALAEADLLEGNALAALTRLEPWLDRASPYQRMATTLLPLLAWACSDLGDGLRSTALLAECREQTRARHYLLVLVEALRIQAVLSLRQAHYPEVVTVLEEALHLARQIPIPYAEAKALAVYGDLLVARGQLEGACEQYAAALAIFRSLGEVLYSERIEQALVEMSHH